MGYMTNEAGEMTYISGSDARKLRQIAGEDFFQPATGEKAYFAAANGKVYSENWFDSESKRIQQVALLRIGNVHPTKEAARAWFAKFGPAFLEGINDL